MENFKKYFNEDFDLEEAISFTGYFEFNDSQEELEFHAKWAKNLNGEIAKIKSAQGSEVQIFIKQPNNRYKKRPGYYKFKQMTINSQGIPYIRVVKVGQEDQPLSYKFVAFFKPQGFTKNPDKLYYLVANGILKTRLEIYLEDKKNQKANKRTAAFQGARSVLSLSDEERKLALDWFSDNISSINIKYPTGIPTYTEVEGALDSKNPTVRKCAEKFARLDAKFHNDFGVSKNITEGYLDSAKKVHFEARDASEIHEKTVEYYNMWGLSCLINFKDTLEHANDIVLSLIAQAKKDSSEAKNEVGGFKLEDRSIDSIFLCYAIKELVEDDWNKLSMIAAPAVPANPFNLDFDSVNAYGEKVESLKEAKEEICCICGEPIEGYGNNPRPYKHEGRCCDACQRKFVIPARLAELSDKEE